MAYYEAEVIVFRGRHKNPLANRQLISTKDLLPGDIFEV